MTKCVALLRGIGPSPNMRNEHLRRAAAGVGLRNVATVISSGNVLFETQMSDLASVEAKLEKAWRDTLGFESTTIIRTQEELEALVELAPYGKRQHGPKTYLLVTFAKGSMRFEHKLPYRPRGQAYQIVAVTPREIFTVTDNTRQSTPDVMSWIEAEFGKAVTSRTWLTVARILKRMA
jgi:uncharacterized protein (DUF1697 family)